MTARTSFSGRCLVGVNRLVNRIIGVVRPKHFRGGPLLFLTTVGRNSGEPRTTPLLFLADGDRSIVVASNGGCDWEPGWQLNLATGRSARIEVGGQSREVTGHELEGAEREAMWERLNREIFDYEGYQRKVSRRIAVIALEPAPADDSSTPAPAESAGV